MPVFSASGLATILIPYVVTPYLRKPAGFEGDVSGALDLARTTLADAGFTVFGIRSQVLSA
jgi:hypothetical protein